MISSLETNDDEPDSVLVCDKKHYMARKFSARLILVPSDWVTHTLKIFRSQRPQNITIQRRHGYERLSGRDLEWQVSECSLILSGITYVHNLAESIAPIKQNGNSSSTNSFVKSGDILCPPGCIFVSPCFRINYPRVVGGRLPWADFILKHLCIYESCLCCCCVRLCYTVYSTRQSPHARASNCRSRTRPSLSHLEHEHSTAQDAAIVEKCLWSWRYGHWYPECCRTSITAQAAFT